MKYYFKTQATGEEFQEFESAILSNKEALACVAAKCAYYDAGMNEYWFDQDIVQFVIYDENKKCLFEASVQAHIPEPEFEVSVME